MANVKFDIKIDSYKLNEDEERNLLPYIHLSVPKKSTKASICFFSRKLIVKKGESFPAINRLLNTWQKSQYDQCLSTLQVKMINYINLSFHASSLISGIAAKLDS